MGNNAALGNKKCIEHKLKTSPAIRPTESWIHNYKCKLIGNEHCLGSPNCLVQFSCYIPLHKMKKIALMYSDSLVSSQATVS